MAHAGYASDSSFSSLRRSSSTSTFDATTSLPRFLFNSLASDLRMPASARRVSSESPSKRWIASSLRSKSATMAGIVTCLLYSRRADGAYRNVRPGKPSRNTKSPSSAPAGFSRRRFDGVYGTFEAA